MLFRKLSLCLLSFSLMLPGLTLAGEKQTLPDLSALSMAELINGFYSNVSCGPGGAMESPSSIDDFNTYKKCIKLNYHYLKAIAKLAPTYFEAYKQAEATTLVLSDFAQLKKDFDDVAEGEAAWNTFFSAANSLDYNTLTDEQNSLLADAIIHLHRAPNAVDALNAAVHITEPAPTLD